jgi:hypothetical protein
VRVVAMAIRKKIREKLHHAKERVKKNKVGKVAIEKFSVARHEPRIPVLLIVEFFLSMILVLAAIVYFDPKINLVPWPFNVIVFMIICGIVVYLYGFSQSFREESREFFEIKKRW